MPDTLAPSVTDVVELTRALVRCESVTPVEAGALQLLERTLGGLGFRCERMDFRQAGTDDVANLYARIGSGGKHFCFAGHSDVVPVGDLSSWTIGPFSAELSAGYQWRRGLYQLYHLLNHELLFGGYAARAMATMERLLKRVA